MQTSNRLTRSLAAGAAAALVVPAAIAFSPAASAATVDTGDAGSTATVLSITAGVASGVASLPTASHTAKAITATLSASSINSPATALVDVVPVTLDGTKYGEQKISSGSKTVSPVTKSVAGAVSLTSPSIALTSSTVGGPVARLTSATVGSASILGMTLPAFTGSLNFGSSVVDKTADASKTVQVKAFSLPSLSDLLAALGLDISRLSTSTLQSLVNNLNLATTAITTAENALAAIPAATSLVTTDTTALETALGAGNAVLGTIPTTAAGWAALDSTAKSTLLTALGALPGGTALVTAINAADTALTTVQAALTALTNLANTLPGLLVNALDTPLLSIGDVTVGTVAQPGPSTSLRSPAASRA